MSKTLKSVLTNHGVDEKDIDKAQIYQSKYGGSIENLLVNLGALTEDDLPVIYAELLNLQQVTQADVHDAICLDKFEQLNLDFLQKRKWLPYFPENGQPCFITSDPLNWEVRQYLENYAQPFSVKVCAQTVLEQIRISDTSNQLQEDEDVDYSTLSALEEDKLRELASEAPTVNLLNSLITKGLKLGASDMHVEPMDGRCRVRYRVDGVLLDTETIPKRLQLPVASRLKILSGMDIAEKRRPQDGKIEMKIANVNLDIRVSSLPLNEGESIVLRFLRKESVTYDMDVVGMSSDIQQLIQHDLQSTAGVILLTGPTGSGKTTTLYTFLNSLNNDEVKIITLEDPVEYQLEGINQVQVNSDIGFDFATGLRSIVRQDPDIIMLGEIRDKETANIAMQSALTGHLVFSTVHTNDAASAFTRLLDLGVEEFLLNAAIVSIVAQRLARKLCVHCASVDEHSEALCEKYALHQFSQEKIVLKKAVGCEECGHSGYKGRTAVIEYLRCDEDMKSLAKDHSFISAAKKLNRSKGRRTLMEDGMLKAIKGITTIEEIIRVAG